MKFAFLLLSTATTVLGFQMSQKYRFNNVIMKSQSDGLSESEPKEAANPMPPTSAATTSTPKPRPTMPAPPKEIPAKWLPIGGLKAPKYLDGTLAADVGFDPLGIVKSKRGLFWMREAEVKHGRLAMLAAVGWPLSELLHKEIAQTFGLQSILASGDRAPALLNGGLENTWAAGMLVMSIIIAGYLESRAMNSGEIFWASEKPEGYVPGTLGFDPLRLYEARGNKRAMETAEIKNGRLAMMAVTAYVVLEAVTKMPVVQLTPFLF